MHAQQAAIKHYEQGRILHQKGKLSEVFSPDFFSHHLDPGDPDRTPVFILGMPRSGTSLVEQILASHPDVYGAGELRDLGKVLASIRTSDNREAIRNNSAGITRT